MVVTVEVLENVNERKLLKSIYPRQLALTFSFDKFVHGTMGITGAPRWIVG
jgi:hypothetical protein